VIRRPGARLSPPAPAPHRRPRQASFPAVAQRAPPPARARRTAGPSRLPAPAAMGPEHTLTTAPLPVASHAPGDAPFLDFEDGFTYVLGTRRRPRRRPEGGHGQRRPGRRSPGAKRPGRARARAGLHPLRSRAASRAGQEGRPAVEGVSARSLAEVRLCGPAGRGIGCARSSGEQSGGFLNRFGPFP